MMAQMKTISREIDNGKDFDWGRISEDYARFRDVYPEIFYEKIIGIGLCVKGQRVLDLGTGTGVLPRNLYKYGAEFVGSDISENQIAQARRLSAEAGLDIEYVVSPAETVDFPNNSFDTVTACQCYVYFDKSALFPKVHSILKDAGHFCILHMAWLVEESEIAANSERMVLKYNPFWSAHSMKRFVYDYSEVPKGLFEVEDSFSYDLPVAFTRESWHGRMKACRGIGASSLTAEEIAKFEQEHIEYMNSLPESFVIPHFATVLNLRKL